MCTNKNTINYEECEQIVSMAKKLLSMPPTEHLLFMRDLILNNLYKFNINQLNRILKFIRNYYSSNNIKAVSWEIPNGISKELWEKINGIVLGGVYIVKNKISEENRRNYNEYRLPNIIELRILYIEDYKKYNFNKEPIPVEEPEKIINKL